jgi:cobalt/nickel transport system ATP-binding protein
MTTMPALRIESLVHAYPDGTRSLNGIDVSIARGERVALLGPNGAGKSTLILHSNGVLMAQSGSVEVGGTKISTSTLKHAREQVGLVFQDPDDQLFMTTVYDDIAFGPLNMGLDRKSVDERVHLALHEVSLPDAASKSGSHLSFGQRKRIALATVLSMRPALLVLDEPTSNLDPRSKGQMVKLLASLDATMLIATHDMDVAWELCSRAIVLDQGRVVIDSSAREVMSDEVLMHDHGLELPSAVRYASAH